MYRWVGRFPAPGVGKETFDVRVAGRQLVVRTAAGAPALVDESHQLPDDAVPGSLAAAYRDGCLIITADIVSAADGPPAASAGKRAGSGALTAPAAAPAPPAAAPASDVPPTGCPAAAASIEKASPISQAGAPAAPPLPAAAGAGSAVQASLARKGDMSYYYSHRVAAPAAAPTAGKARAMPYSWCDDGRQVKVYVPLAGAKDLADERIALSHGEASVHIAVLDADGEATDELQLLLAKRIVGARVKKGKERLVLTLEKPCDGEWLVLTRKAWEPVYEYGV